MNEQKERYTFLTLLQISQALPPLIAPQKL